MNQDITMLSDLRHVSIRHGVL